MADHPTISTESDLTSPTFRPPRSLAARSRRDRHRGWRCRACVSAEHARNAPAAAQPVSTDRDRSTRRSSAAPSKSERPARTTTRKSLSRPTRRMAMKRATPTRSVPIHGASRTTNVAKWNQRHGRRSIPLASRAIPLISRKSRSAARATGQSRRHTGRQSERHKPYSDCDTAGTGPCNAERGGEAVEVYWQSLLRDIPLTELRDDTSNRDVLAATEEINKLADFRGPKSGGRVTPGTLFRANALYFDPADPKGRSVTPPGVLDGPLISQFLLRDVPYASQWISAQIRTALPASEFLTEYEEWLAIQNGVAAKRRLQFDATPRYITTGRDLAEYVRTPPAFALAATLLLATPGGGTDQRYSGSIHRESLRPTHRTRIGNRKPKALGLPPSGCPMCRPCSPRGSATPSARPTGRSISCTGLCDGKPTAVWRTIASPMA